MFNRVFFYWSPLGQAHDPGGVLMDHYLLCCRDVGETIPKGSRIVGEYDPTTRKLESFGDIFFGLMVAHGEQVLEMAEICANRSGTSRFPVAQMYYWHQDAVIIMARTECDAAVKALESGHRVRPTEYPKRWKGLEVHQPATS